MMWLLTLWSKIKLWAAALLAVLVAIGGAWLYGRSKGKATQRAADDATQAQANTVAAQQQAGAQESRNEVEAEVSQLPPAPAQQVAQADPATAAGELRDDGWTRD